MRSRVLVPPGEGGPKGRMRAFKSKPKSPHPAFGHPLPVGEGPHELTPGGDDDGEIVPKSIGGDQFIFKIKEALKIFHVSGIILIEIAGDVFQKEVQQTASYSPCLEDLEVFRK
jgi:hypothetical protein